MPVEPDVELFFYLLLRKMTEIRNNVNFIILMLFIRRTYAFGPDVRVIRPYAFCHLLLIKKVFF